MTRARIHTTGQDNWTRRDNRRPDRSASWAVMERPEGEPGLLFGGGVVFLAGLMFWAVWTMGA